MTRKELEALSNEDLLGSEQMAKLRQGRIESRLEDKAYELDEWNDWDLLGYDTNERREAEIDRRLEAEEEALRAMTDEDLFGKEYLDELRQEEIERRLADKIAKLILDHAKDDRLRWYPDGRVKVLTSKIADLAPGSAVKQTLAGRRRRFKEALKKRLGAGWKEEGTWVWREAQSDGQERKRR